MSPNQAEGERLLKRFRDNVMKESENSFNSLPMIQINHDYLKGCFTNRDKIVQSIMADEVKLIKQREKELRNLGML